MVEKFPFGRHSLRRRVRLPSAVSYIRPELMSKVGRTEAHSKSSAESRPAPLEKVERGSLPA